MSNQVRLEIITPTSTHKYVHTDEHTLNKAKKHYTRIQCINVPKIFRCEESTVMIIKYLCIHLPKILFK